MTTTINHGQIAQINENGDIDIFYPKTFSKDVYINSNKDTLEDFIGVNSNTLIDAIYPIGSIYMSVNSTNPSTFIGGTWVTWGEGRAPVGVDIYDANFNTVEKSVGGNTTSYTPTGTVSKPSFSGTAASLSHSGGAVQNHTLTINEIPSHTHQVLDVWYGTFGGGNWGGASAQNSKTGTGAAGGGGAHNHGFTQPNAHSYTPAGSVSQPSFTGTVANISTIQKSITCYMFKRTA